MAGLHILRRLSIYSVLCMERLQKSCEVIIAIYDGLSLGSHIKQRISKLTIYKARYLKSTYDEFECFVFGLCKEFKIAFKLHLKHLYEIEGSNNNYFIVSHFTNYILG